MASSSAHDPPMSACDVCGDEFAPTAGIQTCEAHFYCVTCLVEVFHRSPRNVNEFPASCCSKTHDGIPLKLLAGLFDDDFKEAYQLKLQEHSTHSSERTYCANAECATYLPSATHDDTDPRYIVAPCACGTTTCVGCKAPWAAEHVCEHASPVAIPAWLPEYTAECRVKQCPQCKG